MGMQSVRIALLTSLVAGAPLAAQVPRAMPPGVGPEPGARSTARSAQFFLAHTGELQLTDQQVVRLAAIARRAETRRQALRATRDSLRSRMMAEPIPMDSAARISRRRMMLDQARSVMERAREQERAELRDALAVLTADQQARAWEIRGRGARGYRSARPGRMDPIGRPGRAGFAPRPGAVRRGRPT